MSYKVTRHGAGSYTVSSGDLRVRVVRVEYPNCSGTNWIASAEWDRWCISDPVATKREAVEFAVYALNSAKARA